MSKQYTLEDIKNLLTGGYKIYITIQYGLISHYTYAVMIKMPPGKPSPCNHCSAPDHFLYRVGLPYYRTSNRHSHVKAHYCLHCVLSNISNHITFVDSYCCIAGKNTGIVPTQGARYQLAKAGFGFYMGSNDGAGLEIHMKNFSVKCYVCKYGNAKVSVSINGKVPRRLFYCWKCYYN